MRNIFKPSMKITVVLIVLISILQIVLYANGAKSNDSPEANGGIFFDGDSGISLVEETINFSQFEESIYPYAKVTVNYELKNSLDTDQEFNILFIVPPLDTYEDKQQYKVLLDHKDITTSASYEGISRVENWYPSFPHGLKEPYGQEVYDAYLPHNMRITTNQTYGIKIPLTIKASANTQLAIEYLCKGGYARLDEYEKTIYSFVYFLTPAKFWDGEPKIKLNVSFPSDENVAFYSNIPMKEVSPSNYSCDLNKLPEYEWMFTYVSRSGLIYGTNNSRVHTGITAAISLAIYLLALYAYEKVKKKYIINLGYIFSILYFFAFAGKLLDGNIGDAFIYLLLIIIFFIIVPIVYFASIILSKRNVSS